MAINIRIILQPPLDSLVGNAKDQQEIGDNRTVLRRLERHMRIAPTLARAIVSGRRIEPVYSYIP